MVNAVVLRRKLRNKGKLIGQKPPLRPRHAWPVRTKLRMDRRMRDLTLGPSDSRQPVPTTANGTQTCRCGDCRGRRL